jgi:hypothetical protein
MTTCKEKQMPATLALRFPTLIATLFAGLVLSMSATGSSFPGGQGSGSLFTGVTGLDDWLPGPPSGVIRCQEGDFTGDPLQPCTVAGSGLQIRDAEAQSFMTSTDDRLAGLLTYIFNANFDGSYTGPAWGVWTLEVFACDGAWEGTWTGRRTFVPGPNPLDAFLPPPGIGGVWISELKSIGHGTGCLEGLKVKSDELATTFTPIPIAYEMIPGLCDFGCPPEGIIEGRILEPGLH